MLAAFFILAALILHLIHRTHRIMASQADLNVALDDAKAAVDAIPARVAALLAAATPPPVDLSAEVAKAQAIKAAADSTALPVVP